jgi:hypothetical protein
MDSSTPREAAGLQNSLPARVSTILSEAPGTVRAVSARIMRGATRLRPVLGMESQVTALDHEFGQAFEKLKEFSNVGLRRRCAQ